MSIKEKLIACLIENTGISLNEAMLENVSARFDEILGLIGFNDNSEEVVEEGKVINVAKNGIDDNLIKYLEELSRLKLSEEEEKEAKADLTKILGYIDMLNEIDTTDVEPMSHPFSYTNNFREDVCVESTERELILKNAPQQKDGCFKVPTTVEQGGL